MKLRGVSWINPLLCLVLLLQSLAVAAAPRAVYSKDQAGSFAVAAQPPCHGQATASAQDPDSMSLACCCDEQCPNMTTCMLGHWTLSARFTVAMSPADAAGHVPVTVRTVPIPPQTLLRPPITFHG